MDMGEIELGGIYAITKAPTTNPNLLPQRKVPDLQKRSKSNSTKIVSE